MNFKKWFRIDTPVTLGGFILATTLLAIVTWWTTYTSVEIELHSRLMNEANRIEAVILSRVSTYENSLTHVRGYFLVNGVPRITPFHDFIASLDLPSRHPGTQGIGYLTLIKSQNLADYILEKKKDTPNFQISPEGPRDKYAVVSMIEPMDWRNEKNLGFDYYSEIETEKAINTSIESNAPILSRPIRFRQESEIEPQPDFVLFLPIYKGKMAPETSKKRLEDAVGALFTPFRSKDFFVGAFGDAAYQKEKVNFSLIASDDPFRNHYIYTRFDQVDPSPRDLVYVKTIELYGRKWEMRVTPLSHFFSASDLYLPDLVGIIVGLISALIVAVFWISQKRLILEKQRKESILVSETQILEQVTRLKQLNELSRNIVADLDMDHLLKTFFDSVVQIDGVHFAVLYFSTELTPKAPLIVHHLKSVDGEHLKRDRISREEIVTWFGQRTFVRRGEQNADLLLANFFGAQNSKPIHDWIMISLPPREESKYGVLLLGTKKPITFDESDVEFIESFVGYFSIGIENSRLYRKADDANRSKSAFLANMSHEIRTPLNAVIGFSEMMTHSELPESQRKAIATSVRKNGAQLTRLIDDILDLSKVEAGKLVIEKKPVFLRSVLQEIQSVMGIRAEEKAIQFNIQTVGVLPQQIETDEVRLYQILMNLVGNAIKFTEFGGVALTVKCSRNGPDETRLYFSVVDSGIGISDESQKELFKPFSQGDTTATRRFGGAGLGLALSKRLAQQLGGDIQLQQSRKDVGSTFTVHIQCGDLVENTLVQFESGKNVIEGDSEDSDNLDVDLKEKSILVVEDSEDNQEIFEYFLTSAGAQVDLASNGIEAVEKASGKAYDLILMDIQLPGIDGKEATRRIRAQGFQNPVIALTAHTLKEERESCISSGCNDQITKPITGKNFLKQVQRHLGLAP